MRYTPTHYSTTELTQQEIAQYPAATSKTMVSVAGFSKDDLKITSKRGALFLLVEIKSEKESQITRKKIDYVFAVSLEEKLITAKVSDGLLTMYCGADASYVQTVTVE